MRKLDDALERQRAVQRKRTFAWGLFALLVPISLLFWSEVIFAVGHLAEVGFLQLAAELIVALFSTYAAVQTFRSGTRFNRMLSDTSLMLDGDSHTD